MRPLRCKHPRSIARQSSYRLGNAKETTAGKDFFIIVNRLLTIANAVLFLWGEPALGRRIEAAVRPNEWHKMNQRFRDYIALTTAAIARQKRTPGRPPFTWIWSRSGQNPCQQ